MLNQAVTEAKQELTTLRDYLRWCVTQFSQAKLFYGHGTEDAWDEAAALIAFALNLSPDVDSRVLDAKLTSMEKDKVLELVRRRINDRIPLPYLTHEAWFAGLSFYVDERVLIPRSPLAELIENQFSPWLVAENIHRILDVCTGSGCIAIACAAYYPHVHVDASDISDDALEIAKMNCEREDVSDRVRLIKSDLFSQIPSDEEYDLIISNPPYVSTEEMAQLPAEYHHEPALGLKAEDKGLSFVTRIMKDAPKFLKEEGCLIVEVGNTQAALLERYPDIPFVWLDFARGGEGVFLLTAESLKMYHNKFK